MAHLPDHMPVASELEGWQVALILSVCLCLFCFFLSFLRQVKDNMQCLCSPVICLCRCCCGSGKAKTPN